METKFDGNFLITDYTDKSIEISSKLLPIGLLEQVAVFFKQKNYIDEIENIQEVN